MDKNIVRPFFSIIQPVYDLSKDQLTRSITSVLAQQFEDWELLIIVDGTCPDLKSLSDLTNDKRIKRYYIEHGGVSAARNFGIAKAEGLYICFLDGDDLYLPNHLSTFNRFLKNHPNPICIVRTGMSHHYKNKLTKTGLYDPVEWKSPAHFFLTNFFGIITICVHHSITRSFLFNENSKYLEDTDFVVRIILNFPFTQISEYTTIAYAHQAQSSNKIYFNEDPTALVEEAMASLKDIYSNGAIKLSEFLPKDFDRFHVSTKYLQYANGCLENRRIRSSLILFRRSLNSSLPWIKPFPYLKYLLKFPYFLLLNLLSLKRKPLVSKVSE